MKRFVIFWIVLGLFLTIGLTATAQDSTKIGLSLPNHSQEFHILLQAAAQTAADTAGVELLIPETDAAFDIAIELANVEELIAAEVDILLIYPVDEVESVPAVQAASDAGIPIVLLEYDLAQAKETDSMLNVVSRVTVDWEAVGADAAAYICDEIGGEGTVLMMQSAGITAMMDDESDEDMDMMMTYPAIDAVNTATTAISTYFEASCADASLVVETTETFTNEDSLMNFETMLSENSRPAAVIITDADVAIEAINMMRAARLRGVTTIALERSDDILGALEGGQLDLAIIPDPEQLGEAGVTAAVAFANGEELEATVTVDSVQVDSETAEQYRDCPPGQTCT